MSQGEIVPRPVLLRLACWGAPLVFAFAVLIPVRNRIIDGVILLAFGMAAGGWLVRGWRRPVVRSGILAALALPLVLLSLPAHPSPDVAELGDAYAAALVRYEGTRYWWGGENGRGIDCSGLIRAAMMDACLSQGLRHLDGGLLRRAADLWWHDASAEALGRGHRGLTVSIMEGPSLNALDSASLRIGDLAIAGGGCHILAHLGGGRWIQADPQVGRVIVEKIPSQNEWFKGPVTVVRWAALVGKRG